MGLAYLAGARGRVQSVEPFPVSEPVVLDRKPAKTVAAILEYLPEDIDRSRVVGGTVLSLCLLDPEGDLRVDENQSRWRQFAAFLVRGNGRVAIPVQRPEIEKFDRRTGVGTLIPKEAGYVLGHSIILPNPYPDDVSMAVRLSEPGEAPIYGALHRTVPELVVERSELAY